MEKAMQDPAAELSQEDSALWLELFTMLKKDRELTAKLLYLRGVGCRLVEHGRSYKIVPIIVTQPETHAFRRGRKAASDVSFSFLLKHLFNDDILGTGGETCAAHNEN